MFTSLRICFFSRNAALLAKSKFLCLLNFKIATAVPSKFDHQDVDSAEKYDRFRPARVRQDCNVLADVKSPCGGVLKKDMRKCPKFENSAVSGILVVDGQSSRSHPSGWVPTRIRSLVADEQ
jgi:hypothetical protein